MESIKFNQNWNNKLQCNIFTTFRLANPNKYITGKEFEIWLKDKLIGHAVIVFIYPIFLDKINNYMAYLDTGYNAEEMKNLLKTMYKNKNIDFDRQQLFCLMLKYTNPKQKDLFKQD